MKHSQDILFKLAAKFQKKYAQGQSLKEIVENAASYGESSGNGIMNFPAQLKKDQADLGINVTISGKGEADVSSPTVDPGDKAPNYTRLPQQIKAYLDKNIGGFPQIPRDQTVTLWYSGKDSGSGIAKK